MDRSVRRTLSGGQERSRGGVILTNLQIVSPQPCKQDASLSPAPPYGYHTCRNPLHMPLPWTDKVEPISCQAPKSKVEKWKDQAAAPSGNRHRTTNQSAEAAAGPTTSAKGQPHQIKGLPRARLAAPAASSRSVHTVAETSTVRASCNSRARWLLEYKQGPSGG